MKATLTTKTKTTHNSEKEQQQPKKNQIIQTQNLNQLKLNGTHLAGSDAIDNLLLKLCNTPWHLEQQRHKRTEEQEEEARLTADKRTAPTLSFFGTLAPQLLWIIC